MPESGTQLEPPRGVVEGSRQGAGTSRELTDDLVKKVADKVYAMLMADIAIERERQRPSSRVIGRTGDW